MKAQILLLALLTFPAQAQSVVLSNDKLELTVLTTGGSFSKLLLRKDAAKINPLWNPARPGSGRGHFICVDGFGPVSPEERAAGLPGHGEAHNLPFKVSGSGKQGATSTLSITTTLPILQENFTRTVRLVDGENVIYVHSELESLLGFDRPAVWAEHATIGSPFLEQGVTAVDISGSRSQTRPVDPPKPDAPQRRLQSGKDFTWPMAPGKSQAGIDLRAAPVQSASTIDHTTTLIDPTRAYGFVTAINPKQGLIVGWVFKREEYPWLQTWENYLQPDVMARGVEFSTQPYDVPRRQAIQLGTMFDAPTYRWLPAKGKIESKFLIFFAKAPAGMTRVDDVLFEKGKLVILDKASGKRLELTASLPL